MFSENRRFPICGSAPFWERLRLHPAPPRCRSPALFQLHLWGGLLIFCGFVVYDTQAIIEKRRRGDKDAIRHSLDLFIDFIQLFRKILILLMQKVSRE